MSLAGDLEIKRSTGPTVEVSKLSELNEELWALYLAIYFMPEWWNRQTRLTQNQVSVRACGFKSRLGHQKIFFDFYKKKCYNIYINQERN